MRHAHCLLIPFVLTSLWAQDQSATPPATTPSQPAAQQAAGSQEKDKSADRSKTKGTQKKTSNDRLFFALPNFLTLENGSNAPPLTAAEKFKVTARDTFDPVEFAWYGLQAGISQARDHANYLYGQGMRGFGERFGVVFGDGTIENFFTKAIFPSVLHQDPRYFQKGKGGFWRRASYAVSRVFITRSDSGQTEVNFSELIGSATAAGISAYTYHPHSDRNVGGVIDTWGTQVGFDALSYTLKEFWPDLRRKMSHTPPANTAR